jgi:hydroxymethylpyrimidine pyrophosphatase-like HAD family hydrolase
MLRAVDVPCAPENAIDEVKAACKYVLASHNDGAIADLIEKVIPQA